MNTDNFTFDVNEADKAQAQVEINLFKEFLVSRFRTVDQDQINRNKGIGIILGAVAQVTGDFIGYATEIPDVSMQQFTEKFNFAVLKGTIERAMSEQATQTAP